jgi:chromatin segregation and condensation protein Rec8/ScpA/Scc1 (kleisin family)
MPVSGVPVGGSSSDASDSTNSILRESMFGSHVRFWSILRRKKSMKVIDMITFWAILSDFRRKK